MSIEASFTGTLERVGISGWINQSGRSILQLLGNKMAHADRGNAVLSGQQKQQNVPTGHVIKVVAAGLCTVFFQIELTSRWTSTFILTMTMRFSPHTEQKRLH